MYIPKPFQVTDEEEIAAFIDSYNFAQLITVNNGAAQISHLPMLHDRGQNCLSGHLARANPHWRGLMDSEALAVFTGPHAYVSPAWYRDSGVPTWNYTAVHVHGRIDLIESEPELREIVVGLTTKHEQNRPRPWTLDTLKPEIVASMLRNIVGFAIHIDRIEAKYKLSQNRSAADRSGVVAALRDSDDSMGRELAAAMSNASGTD
ncbi:MAG: FMN-binding negative transcriptional regulator [Gammaproteobacteria bacterium]|nr:FMN-binding negative transcriptional regulator [Gammaproteobacteria bacterium]